MNYCGIREDFLDYVVDRNPYKHHKFLPGTHIPVFPPERLAETKPDYVLILPWNLRDEISRQLEYVRQWVQNSWCRFRGWRCFERRVPGGLVVWFLVAPDHQWNAEVGMRNAEQPPTHDNRPMTTDN